MSRPPGCLPQAVGFALVLALGSPAAAADDEGAPLVVQSPDGSLELRVLFRNAIYYSVSKNGTRLLDYSPVSLALAGGKVLGEKPVLERSAAKKERRTVAPVWGRRKTIVESYNGIDLSFAGGYSVEFRVFNLGVAYRIAPKLGGTITIENEQVEYRLPDDYWAYFPTQKSYETGWEFKNRWSLDTGRNIYLPLVARARPGSWVAITESDVVDYPSLFLQKTAGFDPKLIGTFERYPTSLQRGGFNNFELVPKTRGEFIARTSGTRTLPWRIFMVGSRDIDLVENDLVYLLARPSAMRDTGWIKPGKAAWEWWHDYTLHGVSFKTGVNTETYLAHADFAARHGLEYLLIDWKWTDSFDLGMVSPEVDIRRITEYARKKGVAVIVWCPAYTLVEQLDQALDNFVRWGISGIKVDFFGRDDQLANQMYERIAAAAARRKLVVDFHGCAKPTGLDRAYPNILNYEAVAGGEGNKFGDQITPEHDVAIPYIRGLAGPMDYTPGGLRNAAKGEFHAVKPPMTQGTRVHQMAMYVVYYEPLAMLVDSPTAYEREPEIVDFIAGIPTSWDETRVLDGVIGDHLVIARRKGTTWWIGALNDWDARSIRIDLGFLGPGRKTHTLFFDGMNADQLATDYLTRRDQPLEKPVLEVRLARGGGAVIRIENRP